MTHQDSYLADTVASLDPPADPGGDGLWISKEGGNRRMPFDPARLLRAIQSVHAEFPQLDLADYQHGVLALVQRRQQLSADELVDLLIRRVTPSKA